MVSYSWRARVLTPTLASKETSAWPGRPFFVVIMMTPLAPRAPYRALDAASLRTVIDSISPGAIVFMLPSYGTPSTTIRGSLPALTEEIPRTRIVAEAFGAPLEEISWTPATWPARASVTLVTCERESFSSSSTLAEPVKASLVVLPNATTMVSSSISVSTSRTTLMLVRP